MSSNSQKFVLVGPHEGKTVAVNGHEFVDGEYEFHGSSQQIAVLTNIFSFYGAVPAEKAELDRLRGGPQREPGRSRKELDEAIRGLPGEQNDPDYVVNAMRAHFGEDLFTDADEARVRELVVKPAGDAPQTPAVGSDTNDKDQKDPVAPSLAEAIGMLDPEVDSHWTSNNLPGLDDLERLTGKKVTRQEVDAIASGYTRAKARQAKAGN